MNGFSAEINASELTRLFELPRITVSKVSAFRIQKQPRSYDSLFDNLATVGLLGEGTVVSVIDLGIDLNHADMALTDAAKAKLKPGNMAQLGRGRYFTAKVPFGYNYADKNLDIFDRNSETHMHGMHVAGIIGANGSKKGVAPEVQLLAMKVFSNQSGTKTYYTDDVIMALEDSVTLGADVINLSLAMMPIL